MIQLVRRAIVLGQVTCGARRFVLHILLVVGSGLWFGCSPQISPGMRAHGVSDYSLYTRIGGEATISKVVDRFMERVRADPDVGFDDAAQAAGWQPTSENVRLLKQRMTEFLCVGFGGPQLYTGRSIYQTHHAMNLSAMQFECFVQDLLQAMAETGVPESLRLEAENRLKYAKNAVVSSPPASQPTTASAPATRP